MFFNFTYHFFIFDLQKLDIPWFAILKSMPNWAIVVSNICYDWGGYTFVTCIPAYMKEVLKFDISSVSIQSTKYFIIWIVPCLLNKKNK